MITINQAALEEMAQQAMQSGPFHTGDDGKPWLKFDELQVTTCPDYWVITFLLKNVPMATQRIKGAAEFATVSIGGLDARVPISLNA